MDGVAIDMNLRKNLSMEIERYIDLLRKYEYCCEKRDKSPNWLISKFWVLQVIIYDRRKNQLGIKLGIEVTPGMASGGLRICHQNVIINGYVGENCTFHGHNVIGNKKTGASHEIPTIGKNVDVGIGAIIVGKIEIADDCIIGAGSVVTKSFLKPGTVIAGVPAKEINIQKV
jgi:serine O-acetyltransferase